ncbi:MULTISPECIES: phage tail protein [Streptomyces]|uniref:Phage tail protein n=2 Tax=Streptomyces TaxID=1883 RepID=A0ABU4K1N7_9ACTN|nr:phage tail protein [Streptomyces roseolus]MDX2291661.1 phage tail protein [Streptomyces roseolus]
MATAEVRDPYVNFNFLVELDSITRGSFHEVSGMESSVEVIEHREGGWNTTPRKFPGQTKHGNLVLKWGMVTDTELYDWHREVVQGKVNRRNGSVILLDHTGAEVARWDFVRAWPTKYTAPGLNAESSDIAIETLELVHEGLERVR